jgi:hypothetical protein
MGGVAIDIDRKTQKMQPAQDTQAERPHTVARGG